MTDINKPIECTFEQFKDYIYRNDYADLYRSWDEIYKVLGWVTENVDPVMPEVSYWKWNDDAAFVYNEIVGETLKSSVIQARRAVSNYIKRTKV